MKTLALLPSVALVLALTAGAAAQKAQPALPPGVQPGTPWGPGSAPEVNTPYTEWMRSTVSFEFRGGTLKEYVDTVRAAAKDKPVNVMFRDGAEQSPVAATSMRDVSILSALQAPTDSQGIPQGRGYTIYLQQVSGGGSGGGQPYAQTTVPAFVYVGANRQYTPVLEVFVLSLNEVCTPPWIKNADPCSLPSADVLKAVETAVEAVGERTPGGKPADLAFHRESGLLVVKGTDRQITAAKNVIQSLGQDVRRLRETRAIDEDKKKNDVGEVEVQRIRASELEKIVQDQRNQVERERARYEMLRKELDSASRQITELQIKLDAMNKAAKKE